MFLCQNVRFCRFVSSNHMPVTSVHVGKSLWALVALVCRRPQVNSFKMIKDGGFSRSQLFANLALVLASCAIYRNHCLQRLSPGGLAHIRVVWKRKGLIVCKKQTKKGLFKKLVKWPYFVLFVYNLSIPDNSWIFLNFLASIFALCSVLCSLWMWTARWLLDLKHLPQYSQG